MEDVFEDKGPILLLSPSVDVDETSEEIDVIEFLREPSREGEGVVIGDTNDKDPFDSSWYACTLSITYKIIYFRCANLLWNEINKHKLEFTNLHTPK